MTIWGLTPARILAQDSIEAQRQALLAPPPPIEFAPWKEVDSDEFSRVYEETFPSDFVTPYPENSNVHLRVFLPTDVQKPVPAVVILHYWGATDLSLESNIARELNNLGIAGVVMTLPYHLQRTPKGSRSGEMALQSDPSRLVGMMVQSTHDVRRTVDWIQSRPEFEKNKVALAGTSLGGMVASLAYGIEKRFVVGSFALAGVDLAGIFWESSKAVTQREEMRRKGMTEERLRRELEAVEPAQYLDKNDGRRELVIAASLDSVVPPKFARMLAQALGEPSEVWLSTGHYGGALARGRIVRTVARFFESSFKGQTFEPPASIKAPTLYFGLVYSPIHDLQVTASVDLWRTGRQGETFASAMLTPQGVQGFLGQRLGPNLSVGAAIFPSRIGPAVCWRIAF
ncbi:MAG: alpha/beta hydrolase family protein [Armatimonadetes bacterium]|nr:alpha/beta hydrolase family protein [Armatimonadota bacterium]